MTTTEINDRSTAMAPPGAPQKEKSAKSKTQRGVRKKKLKKPSKPAGPRRDTKAAAILNLLGRARGATLVELMKATGWQGHSVRGFLSTAGKKRGIPITSVKNESGTRVYRVSK